MKSVKPFTLEVRSSEQFSLPPCDWIYPGGDVFICSYMDGAIQVNSLRESSLPSLRTIAVSHQSALPVSAVCCVGDGRCLQDDRWQILPVTAPLYSVSFRNDHCLFEKTNLTVQCVQLTDEV